MQSEWSEPEEHKQHRLKLKGVKAGAASTAAASGAKTDSGVASTTKPVEKKKRKKTVSYATLELVGRLVLYIRHDLHSV